MAIRRFLGVMEAEMGGISEWPEHIAWMGCHFSPESGRICGLPGFSLPGGMLVLEDKVPFFGGDIGTLCGQMAMAVRALSCEALLLDFQKPVSDASSALAEALTKALPCPVILPPLLAKTLEGPVFLPPAPPDVSLEEYLAPWTGREIWLEVAMDGLTITLTETGADSRYHPHGEPKSQSHREEKLHCHYHAETAPHQIRFTLWRSREDVDDLIREAEMFGVTGCVGLWQELG